MKRRTKFKKIYVLDTNIILNDVENIFLLSNNGENLIAIPETVFDELDNKKSGFEEINYQAREFGRMYDDAEILEIDRSSNKKLTTIASRVFREGKVAYITVYSKKRYDSDNGDYPLSVKNDRKIIEIARDIQTEKAQTYFVSLDIMAKNRALTLGLNIHHLKTVEDKPLQLSANLVMEGNIKETYPIFEIESMDVPSTVQQICITDTNGKPYYYYKTGSVFKLIDEKMLARQEVTPQNLGQKVLSSQMLDNFYDVVISDSPAGSGKTLIALSAAMRLLDTQKDKYDKIVYIRKTVISDTEELGFLKGDLNEKMTGYLAPLYSNLEFIVEKKYNKKKTKLTKDELDNKLIELMNKYQIKFKYEGHLRGDNIRNAVVILDESQNDSVTGLKTILTRVDNNCKVFALGSTRQIDTSFLNKYNNALTFLLNKIGQDNMKVNVTGFNLDKTVRSKIAEWADEF